MFLLASIPDCERDSLLVIGPRYEPELLMAVGLGWNKDGVRGLDTFSYSPVVDVGDMHQLPYGDASFSSLICCVDAVVLHRTGSGGGGDATRAAARRLSRRLDAEGRRRGTTTSCRECSTVPIGSRRSTQLDGSLQPAGSGWRASSLSWPTAEHGHTIAAYRRPMPT